MALLVAQGKATMQQRPNKPTNKGKCDNWAEDLVGWMIQHEWLTEEEALGLSAKALSTAQQHEVSKDTILVLDYGRAAWWTELQTSKASTSTVQELRARHAQLKGRPAAKVNLTLVIGNAVVGT